MRRATALKHVAFEDLGTLEPALRQAGFDITMLQAGIDNLALLDPLVPDLLIVLGGPIGAYETESYPYIRDEIALIAARLAARQPTLGICLGAQLMASALNAQELVGTEAKEIGWAPVARASGTPQIRVLDALLNSDVRVLHWHGDTFQLPADAIHLATSDRYTNQAFAVGNYGLGLQLHAEVRL